MLHQIASIECRLGVAYGDSLTYNSSGGIPVAKRWVSILSGRLRTQILNRGNGGDNSAAIKARMVLQPKDRFAILWPGYNDLGTLTAQQIQDAAAEQVAWLGHSRFVILSVISRAPGTDPTADSAPTLQKITDTNILRQAAWPSAYIEVRSLLTNPATRNNGAAIPDSLHLSEAGSLIVANALEPVIRAKKWAMFG